VTTVGTVICVAYFQIAQGNLLLFLLILMWYNSKRTQLQQLPMAELQKIRYTFLFFSVKM